jgi:exosortase
MAAVERQPVRPTLDLGALRPQLLLIAPALLLAIPTFIRLGQQVWTKEIGAQGPIVLATGAWLVWRRWDAMSLEAQPGAPWLTMAGVLVSLPIYVFGRAYDFLSLEALGLYGFGLTLLHDRFGLKAMLSNWFPLFYLGFLLPAPGWLIDQVTAPLKLLVTTLATTIVDPTGIPIMQQGVTMTVGPYQLLVEDACSGMNSLIGLISITLFYIYLLRNASWRYSLFLVSLIIPVAIAANVLRIIILILLTYFFGDAVGQGFLHVTSGLLLFALSLLLMFAIDSAASRVLAAIRRPA